MWVDVTPFALKFSGYGDETISRLGNPERQPDMEKMKRTRKPGISRRSTLALMGAGPVTFATPWVARAQAKTIRVGMPTILSGRVAQLGTSSRNAVMLEVEKVNAAGGLAGRQIEMVIRDSGPAPGSRPHRARTRQYRWLRAKCCSMAKHRRDRSRYMVARDLGVLCIHTCT